MRSMRSLALAAVLLVGSVGCAPRLGSLEGHNCDSNNRCLSGYTCEEGVCIAVDGGGGPDGGRDAGTDGGPGVCADGGTPHPEICNGLDDNCDGVVPADEADNDKDGYRICDGDCNDNDPTVHPGATEICDGKDDDCNPADDPPGDVDNDKDGYPVCAGDCNDDNPAVHPGAKEVCDGVDNNCDGRIDELPPTYAPPQVTIDGAGTSSGQVIHLAVTDPPLTLTAHIVSCDPVGCPSGTLATTKWYVNTRDAPPPTTPSVSVGPPASGGNLQLPIGLHEILLVASDACPNTKPATAKLEVQIGDPITTSVPATGETDIRAVCAGPGADQAWVGTADAAMSLDANVSMLSEDTGTGVIRACTVDGSGEAYFGRNGNNDSVHGYPSHADLSVNPETFGVSGTNSVVAGQMAVDGHDRVWLLASDGQLKVLDRSSGGGNGTFVVPSNIQKPPDGANVTCLTYDGNGHLWACTSKGINRLDVSAADVYTTGQKSWWLWQSSKNVVGDKLQTSGYASALAADGSVLWVLTQDIDNVVLRMDLSNIDACGDTCDIVPRVLEVDTSNWQPAPTTTMNDAVIWQDGDLMIGADSGLYRLQFWPPGATGWQPYMFETLSTATFRDLAIEQASGRDTLYGATASGVFRYRGQ